MEPIVWTVVHVLQDGNLREYSRRQIAVDLTQVFTIFTGYRGRPMMMMMRRSSLPFGQWGRYASEIYCLVGHYASEIYCLEIDLANGAAMPAQYTV